MFHIQLTSREMKVKEKLQHLTRQQTEILNTYFENDMLELRKMCIPLIMGKRVAGMEFDELIDDAMNVFIDVLLRYDEEKNDNFAGFLHSAINMSYATWTRDRMRESRVNYARDSKGKVLLDKDGQKVIITPLHLDAMSYDSAMYSELVASDFDVEKIVIDGNKKWTPEIEKYLDSLSPLQRKIMELLADKHSKEEICQLLHIESRHYDNLLERARKREKVEPLLRGKSRRFVCN